MPNTCPSEQLTRREGQARAPLRVDRSAKRKPRPKHPSVTAFAGTDICRPITLPMPPALMIESRDAAESADDIDAAEPMDSADAAEPIEPIDSTEPIEPIESKDPRHPMHSIESSDHSDHFEFAPIANI
jgi:hypothetical protein